MMVAADYRDAQVPYAPYRIEHCAPGGQVTHPATGVRFALNAHAAALLRLCDGWHNLGEIIGHIAVASASSPEQIEAQALSVLHNLTVDGLVWWRRERVRHFQVAAPEMAYLDLTMRCNLRCAHCGVSAGEASANELSSEQLRDALGQLAQLGVAAVCFSGGEPLLHADLFALAEHARTLGLVTELSTNGTLIDEQRARQIAAHFQHVQVSLDGASAAVHERLRGHGTFARTVSGISQLRAAGVAFTLGCVLHRDSLHDVEALAGLAGELGADALRLIHFVPAGRGAVSAQLEPSLAELRDLAQRMPAIRRRAPLPVSEVNFEFLFGPPEPLTEEVRCGPINCGGGWSSLTLTPTGDVLPCSFFVGMRCDNLRDRPLAEIWARSPLFNYLRSLRVSEIGGKCATCRWLAMCRGGCPAANLARGKLMQPHVQCFLTPEEAAEGLR